MKDTQFKRNGECHYANYFIQKLQPNSNSRHQNSQREEFRPSLISLDPTDLSRPLFCYTLQLGVTMLGSGKNCLKPPDIVLHGSSVAPQHAFVERLANESVLHPISSQTSLNGRPVQGPTPLQSGALISIGDSYYFRYNSGPSKSPAMQQNQFSSQQARAVNNPCFYDDESPYAVVNNRGKGSCSVDSAGDVNKNRDALSTCEGSPSKTHRDSLESSNFSNKLARFECLSYKKPPFPTVNEQNLNFKPATMPRPSVSFNRSDQGYSSHLFYSNTTPTPESSSSSSSDRFKKPLSAKVTFFDEDEEDASSLANQCSSSIPSPDSLSSISNKRLYFSGGITVKATSSSPTDSHMSALTEMEEVDGGVGGEGGGLTCESLLERRRHQLRCSPQKTETCLGLDEILAMCAEYEEQISKEIQEKKSTEKSSSSLNSPVAERLPDQNGSLRSPGNGSTPTSPHFYSNGRIKTNGSLPRDPSRKEYFLSGSLQNNSHHSYNLHTLQSPTSTSPAPSTSTSFVTSQTSQTLEDITSTSFTFSSGSPVSTGSFSDGKKSSSPSNGFTTSTPIPPTTPPPPTTVCQSAKSPYENLPPVESSQRKIPQSPSKIRTTPEFPKIPQSKSKLSVSFSNSVQEFYDGKDDDEEDDKLDESGQLRINGQNDSILRTTEAQVHNEAEQVENSLISFTSFNEPIKNDERNEFLKSVKVVVTDEKGCESDSGKLGNEKGCYSNCGKRLLTPPNTLNFMPNSSSTSVSQLVQKSEEKSDVGSGPEGNNPKRFGKIELLSDSTYSLNTETSRLSQLKNEIMELEQQEMEALRELEIEKALLLSEEKSFESQMDSDKSELTDLKDRLCQIDDSNRRWRALSLERIGELNEKLVNSEKELERLEKLHDDFCGSPDEETVLLERLKFQHELVEGDRKAFEDAEFHHMEEEVNKEVQREELTKTLTDIGRKLLSRQFQLEQLRSHNRISINSSAKDIQTLERRRQELIKQLRKVQQYVDSESSSSSPVESNHFESQTDENRNADLEEKLKALCIPQEPSEENSIHIERVKSRSPIDPTLGRVMGPKTFETLREIERNREFLLNEQGAQMLEEERARVRELQKRVQDAVREEWEASRRNQCHSLNSVGSEDSNHTTSDTPTDSTGSGTEEGNEIQSGGSSGSGGLSISTTDDSLSCRKDEENRERTSSGSSSSGKFEQNGFDCEKIKQKQNNVGHTKEDTRPYSDGSSYDQENSVVIRRNDKQRKVQNRPLTRYLPVRGDDEVEFDLRAHIDSSGHQLELCPQLIVTKTTARGFLSKLGGRFNKWNKRWFVFDRETRTLTYFADKNEKKSKPRGGIHFQAIEDVYVDHLQSVKSPNPKLTFCVKTCERVFHLLAPSPEAMRIWIDIIFTGAEGYQQFECPS